jgi:hypothetical protein
MTTKLSVKLDFARVISPKHLNRRKIVWCSSEKRPYFAHFAAPKIEPYFTYNFAKLWLGSTGSAATLTQQEISNSVDLLRDGLVLRGDVLSTSSCHRPIASRRARHRRRIFEP